MLKRVVIFFVAIALGVGSLAFGQDEDQLAAKLRADGIAYVRAGQTSEAIDAYVAAIAANPSLEKPYLELAEILLAARLPDEASSVLKNARGRFPYSTDRTYNELFYRLGNSYIGYGRLGLAADAMEQAVRVKGNVSQDAIYKKLGDLRVDLLEFDGAESAYARALVLNPDNWSAHLALASLNVRRNRLDAALDEFERVLSAVPDNVAVLSGIADVHFRLGRFEEAAAESGRAIELDPLNRPSLYLRGQALLRSGHAEEGKNELRKYAALEQRAQAESLESGDIYALYTEGMARIAKGDFAEAIAVFRRGIESHPEERKFYLALGAALSRSNLHQEAFDAYAEAIQRFGEESEFRQGYNRERAAALGAPAIP